MFREYLQDLREEVTRHARVGKSLDEIKRLVTLPKYAAWNAMEWFPLNTEGMYRLVHNPAPAGLTRPGGARRSATRALTVRARRRRMAWTAPAVRAWRTAVPTNPIVSDEEKPC